MSTSDNTAIAEDNGLPERWVWSTLGDVSEKPQYGWTTKANHETGKLKLIRTTDITSGFVDWSSVPYCTEEPEDVEKYLVESGDILISRAGSVGVSFLINKPERAVFASYLIRFRPKPGIETKYFYYYLKSPAYWEAIGASKAGIAVPNVNASKLAQVPIPVAPLDQQKRIVAEIEKQFSRLDEAVANLKRVKANLKRYKAAVLKAAVEGRLVETEAELARKKTPSPLAGEGGGEGASYETGEQLLQRILETRRSQWKGKGKYKEPAAPDTTDLPKLPEGWVWVSPEQLSAGESYSLAIGPFGSSLKVSDYTKSGVPLVFVRNIRAASFGGSNAVYVTEKKADELRAHRVEAGDLLVTKMGDPPGDVCIYPAHRPPAIITADCIKLRLVHDFASTQFFAYAIESDLVHKQILGITKGVAQLKVSLGRFGSIGFPLPPIAEQHRIAAEVDHRLSLVREVESQVDANLKRVERLRQGILGSAFSGRPFGQRDRTVTMSVGGIYNNYDYGLRTGGMSE